MILGIDPGLKGALAVLDREGSQVSYLLDMPLEEKAQRKYEINSRKLFEMISTMGKVRCFLERVGPIPGSARNSAFTFGRTFEACVSVLKILRVPWEFVDPKVWKADVLTGTSKDKKAACAWVRRKYPEISLVGPDGGVLDGRADAICIAEYGRRLCGG